MTSEIEQKRYELRYHELERRFFNLGVELARKEFLDLINNLDVKHLDSDVGYILNKLKQQLEGEKAK